MTKISRLTSAATIGLALGFAAIAQASPIGAPPANQPPTGKGHSVGGLFDSLVGSDHDDRSAVGDEPAGNGETRKPPHRHLTNAEWRQAYIAKHHHDLPDLRHPGH